MQVEELSKISKDDKSYLLILFAAAITLRLIPELIAYPYPIGYDVINYYLPVITNFEHNWNMVSGQFPLYVMLLHWVTSITNLDPQNVVRTIAILIFGFFSLAVYKISKNILQLRQTYSLFLAFFVIFQISVLRTTWDLHRDMLSLTTMLLAFSYVVNNKKMSKSIFAIVITLCIISVMADRMIGLLLTISLVFYASIRKHKKPIILAAITAVTLVLALSQGFSEIKDNVQVFNGGTTSNSIYSPFNLLILFVVTNIFLIPTGIVGFLNAREISLKIPLIISLLGSLSWILFSFSSSFLPDRWTFIFSIFLSFYAGYGFVKLIIRLNKSHPSQERFVFFATLTPFVLMGTLFAITNSNNPLSLFAPFHEHVGQFGPMTMQYNSLSISESKSIVSAFEWINHNTPIGSNIIIDKRWKGWTEIELKYRVYQFYEAVIKHGPDNNNYYLLKLNTVSAPSFKNMQIQRLYNNDNFSLYRLSFDRLA